MKFVQFFFKLLCSVLFGLCTEHSDQFKCLKIIPGDRSVFLVSHCNNNALPVFLYVISSNFQPRQALYNFIRDLKKRENLVNVIFFLVSYLFVIWGKRVDHFSDKYICNKYISESWRVYLYIIKDWKNPSFYCVI